MKKRWKVTLAVALAVLVLQPFLGTVAALSSTETTTTTMPGDHTLPTPPRQEYGPGGALFIRTSIMTVMANPKVPMFHFWFARDENGSIAKFAVIYLALVEFEDLNSDGAFQSNETLYYAPLAAYDWTLLTGSVEQDGQTVEVWLKYVKGGTRDGGMHDGDMDEIPFVDPRGVSAVDRFEGVTLQIWGHIYLSDHQGNVSDENGVKATYLVPGESEMKMDIEIGNFPFSTNTSRVALQTLLRESDMGPHQPQQHRHRYRVQERNGHFDGTSDMDWNRVPGNETRLHNRMNTHTQQVGFYDVDTDAPQGYFSWVDRAQVTWPGGDTDVVNVTASYVPAGVGLALYLAYPNFDDGTLLHDPSIGLAQEYIIAQPWSPLDSPLLLVSMGILVVAVVAVIAVRRR